MSQTLTYRAFDPNTETDTLARLLSLAFAGPVDGCKDWMALGGHPNLRVLGAPGAAPGACLLRIPMGQYFGGRSVPMLGIAGVAVAPESRGQGLARTLMQRAIAEAAGERTALMGLYASTQTLYRSVGFEQAGSRFRIRVPMSALDVRERAGAIVPIADTTDPRVHACYRDFARGINGMVDRGHYIWTRIKKNRGNETQGFGVKGEGDTIDAYAFLHQQRHDTGRHDITLSDLAFRTPAAARRLIGFLADFASMADHLEFFGGSDHPALLFPSQRRFTAALVENWYLRVVDLKAALTGRGYPAGIDGSLSFRYEDPLVPAGNGFWTLRVRAGQATLEPGGNASLQIGPRGMAALYSGFQSAEALALVGLCEGSPEGLAAASGIFVGRAPSMTDFF